MISPAIDQLVQNPAPPRGAAGPSVAAPTDRELFRAHLQRATVAKEAKTPPPKDSDEAPHANAEASIELDTDQEETSTTQQEEPASGNETTETSQPAESSTDAETDDEVTLSTAAIAVAPAVTESAEIVVIAQQIGEVTTNVESTSADQQEQQATGPFTANFVETTEGEQVVPTATESTDTETGLLDGTTEGKTINNSTAVLGESNDEGLPTGQQGESSAGIVSAHRSR